MIALVELVSLGAGLRGDRSAEDGLDEWLWSVSTSFVVPEEKSCGALSAEVCLTFALTLARLLTGSKDMMRALGKATSPTSIESWNSIRRSQESVGAIVVGRVKVAVTW